MLCNKFILGSALQKTGCLSIAQGYNYPFMLSGLLEGFLDLDMFLLFSFTYSPGSAH